MSMSMSMQANILTLINQGFSNYVKFIKCLAILEIAMYVNQINVHQFGLWIDYYCDSTWVDLSTFVAYIWLRSRVAHLIAV